MIGFAMVGTNDLARSRRFYDPLTALLGAAIKADWSTGPQLWYMTAPNAPMLVLTTPRDG